MGERVQSHGFMCKIMQTLESATRGCQSDTWKHVGGSCHIFATPRPEVCKQWLQKFRTARDAMAVQFEDTNLMKYFEKGLDIEFDNWTLAVR